MDGNYSDDGAVRRLPTRYIPLGGVLVRYGVRLVCVRRPRLACVSAACKGCWFRRSRIGDTVINCNDLQCSSWDRMDSKNVWFVEEFENDQ